MISRQYAVVMEIHIFFPWLEGSHNLFISTFKVSMQTNVNSTSLMVTGGFPIEKHIDGAWAHVQSPARSPLMHCWLLSPTDH